MKNVKAVFEVQMISEGRRKMEYFIDDISEKLHISDIYFGNLSAGMGAVISLLLENQHESKVELSYRTDYQTVTINIKGVSRETLSLIEQANHHSDEKFPNELFTLFNVTESVNTNNDALSLVFNIGAISDLVSKKRKKALLNYFEGKKQDKPIKSNDHFYL